MVTFKILLILFVVVLVNALYIVYQLKQKRVYYYLAKTGDYKGQTHNIKDWRKIAVELSKNTKNSRINAIAKHGTDEDIIGLLYINFGIELVDNGYSE